MNCEGSYSATDIMCVHCKYESELVQIKIMSIHE